MNTTAQTCVRARLVWIDAKNKDEELDHQMLVDLVVDPETGMCVGGQPSFGVYGSPARDFSFPFVLRANGIVDYGANADDAERFDTLNIRARRIEQGEVVTYTGTDGEVSYRIAKVGI